MPAVNTLVIHRADMFGLGQLYQLRGRVGQRQAAQPMPYPDLASLTSPPSAVAEKRLTVMQTLDTLGAEASRWPRTIWTFAGPATFWAMNSPAISEKLGLNFINRCWRTRSQISAPERAGARARNATGRRTFRLACLF